MKFIVGNWKSNGTKTQAANLIKSISKVPTRNNIILCLPFTLLNITSKTVSIAAQDVSAFPNGAYTGDVSAQMLSEANVKYVIVGHSERRKYHKENNSTIKKKIELSIKHKLIPIICIGETYKEKLSKKTNFVISEHLNALLPEKGKFIVAYEPRWAIGKGITPNLSDIKSVHKVIRNILNKKGFNNTPILYGASITQDNANAITNLPNVDGLLIGGASLKKETFIPIIESVR